MELDISRRLQAALSEGSSQRNELAAEVESLRAENGKLRVLVEREYHNGYDAGASETQAEIADLRAAVERVRAVCDRWRDDGYGEQDRARVEILRALDGEA